MAAEEPAGKSTNGEPDANGKPAVPRSKFRRTASIVASTLLAGGSASQPAASQKKVQASQNESIQGNQEQQPVRSLSRSRSLMHYKPTPASETSSSPTDSTRIAGPATTSANAPKPTDTEKLTKQVSFESEKKGAAAVAAAANMLLRKKKRSSSVPKDPEDSTPTNPNTNSSAKSNMKLSSIMPPLEWIIVLVALVIFKLGIQAALPLGLIGGAWAFLFMSNLGKTVTGGNRLGPLERKVLWASASVLCILLLLNDAPKSEYDPLNGLTQQKQKMLEEVSEAMRRENSMLKDKVHSIQMQHEECMASTSLIASKQKELKVENEDLKTDVEDCEASLVDFKKFDMLSPEDQYRELLQRQGVLFGQLQQSRSSLMTELADLEQTMEVMDDKKQQVSKWIDKHKDDPDFTKWMEHLTPRAEQIIRVVEEKREKVAKLNKTLTLPCAFENQGMTILRHEIEEHRKLKKTLETELEAANIAKNMTLPEQYRHILQTEKDVFGQLERKQNELEMRRIKIAETRDTVKKKRDRVLAWMQQDMASRNDDDLAKWLKQLEPRFMEVDAELSEVDDAIRKIGETVTLKAMLCEEKLNENKMSGNNIIDQEVKSEVIYFNEI